MTKEKADQKKGFQRILGAFICILAAVLLLGVLCEEAVPQQTETMAEGERTKAKKEETGQEKEVQDKETESVQEETEPAVCTDRMTFGIDVSKFQEEIDWAQVAEAGIDFVMVRVGYRKSATGEIIEDERARYNLQEAAANGIALGAYFFSTAIDEQEVREEADWVCGFLKGVPISYPVVYNCEGFEKKSSRQYGMTVDERTTLAQIFLDQVEAAGYTGMFYAATGELRGSLCWDTKVLESQYQIWVAQYPDEIHPASAGPDYDGAYAMWQYTDQGHVQGIRTVVDLNVAYFRME